MSAAAAVVLGVAGMMAATAALPLLLEVVIACVVAAVVGGLVWDCITLEDITIAKFQLALSLLFT
jgi:hypothetical protein